MSAAAAGLLYENVEVSARMMNEKAAKSWSKKNFPIVAKFL